jgi:tetratricopeptide (TPR) repeat protein
MKRIAVVAVLALLATLCVPAVFAQATGTVKGVAKDAQGNPIAGATVEWHNTDNGRKYTLKTNKKGEYFSLGIEPGKYKVTLSMDGKQLDTVNNFPVQVEDNTLDFDEKKSQTEAAQQQGISPEKLKQMQEAEAKQKQEGNTVKTLNEKLSAANTAMQGGDFDAAINSLNEANQMDPSRDLLWARLGDAYVASAPKQTDAAEKTRRYGEAVTDYQKAIELKQKGMQSGTPKPDDPKTLAAYYNNLAQAQAKSGKIDEAIKSYEQAAQHNPTGSAQY